MRKVLGPVLAAMAILGCERSQPPPAESGSVAPGTVLAEGEFRKTLQATGAKYVLATVFAAD